MRIGEGQHDPVERTTVADGVPDGVDGVPEPGLKQVRDDTYTSTATFAQFYRDQRPRLVAFLVYLGADQQTALDVSQETMLAAYRDWATIRHPHRWIRVVASRALLRILTNGRELPAEGSDSEAMSTPNVLDVVLQREQHQRLLATMRLLPVRQRQVLAWTYDGYHPHEIADMLGISRDAVRANLMKARRTFRSKWAEGQ